jgi:alkylhydroperoxidase family enzyme
MPWIHQVPVQEATGLLRELLDAALGRAGRVWNIVRVMSVNPPLLRDSIAFYRTLMFGQSPLTRAQRELLATVASAEVRCRY